MKRTRVGGKIDAQRVAQLVSMPGIDPRVWCSLCIVDSVVVDDDGIFADVHVMSTATTDDDGNIVAQMETVRVVPEYAGNGFGLYFPIEQGDEVVVEWIDGDPDNGGVLTKRAWSSSDPPPSQAKDNPDDALLVVKKDANLRIIMQGQGNCVLQVDQGKVLLGAEDGTKAVCIDKDKSDAGMLLITPGIPPGSATQVAYVPPPGPYPPPTPPVIQIPLSAIISAGATLVEAK